MPTDAMSSEKSTVVAARWKATGTWWSVCVETDHSIKFLHLQLYDISGRDERDLRE
jgi:hypothetical protein